MRKFLCIFVAAILCFNLYVFAEYPYELKECKYTTYNETKVWDILDLQVSDDKFSHSFFRENICSLTATAQGYVAVALENGNILIYQNGVLYKVIKIDTAYGTYFVFSDNENLIIYLYRGYCYEITVDGDKISIIDFNENDDYTSKFLKAKAKVTSVEVDGKKYERAHNGISRLLGDAGYCEVVEISENGKKIIYESSGPQLHGLLLALLIVTLFTVPIFIIISKIRKKHINQRTVP